MKSTGAERDESRRFRLPSETVLLAATPVIGYAYAWTFEFGYLRYYRLPPSLINVGVTQVVVSSAILFVAVLFLLALLIGLPDRPWWVVLLRIAPSLILAWLGISLLRPRGLVGLVRATDIALSVLLLLSAIGQFYGGIVRPIRERKTPKGWLERIAEDYWSAARNAPRVAMDSVLERLESIGLKGFLSYLLLVYAFLLGGILVMYAGRVAAARPQRHTVRVGSPECVVVRMYGDRVICTVLDRAQKTLGPRFLVLPHDGEFTSQFLGRLRIVSDSTGS